MFRGTINKNFRRIGTLIFAAILAGAFPTNALAQEIDAKTLLEQMSAEIADLDSFIVYGDAYADARLDAGQIIEHASQVTLRLRRKQSGTPTILKR